MSSPEPISVVMATCNGARFIEEQLRSVLAQTLTPCEIVISDDRSDDRTLAIVEAIAAESSIPFRIFRNEQRIGYGDNFLRAAARSRGDWIAFCDQDDIWLPNKLARCASHFALPGVLAVAHNAYLMFEQEKTARLADSKIVRSAVVEANEEGPWRTYLGFSIVFRRQLIDRVDFERRPVNFNHAPLKLPHDDWISFLALSLGRVALIAEPLVWYRRHPEVVTTPKDGVARRLHRATFRYATSLRLQASAAQDRATFLASLSDDVVEPGRRDEAVASYRELAALSWRRERLRTQPSLVARTRAFVSLLRSSAYQRPSDLLKDLCFGALHLDRAYTTLRERLAIQ